MLTLAKKAKGVPLSKDGMTPHHDPNTKKSSHIPDSWLTEWLGLGLGLLNDQRNTIVTPKAAKSPLSFWSSLTTHHKAQFQTRRCLQNHGQCHGFGGEYTLTCSYYSYGDKIPPSALNIKRSRSSSIVSLVLYIFGHEPEGLVKCNLDLTLVLWKMWTHATEIQKYQRNGRVGESFWEPLMSV